MKDRVIGFIGAGNMGSAMIGGICGSGLVTPSNILVSAHSAATTEKIHAAYGVRTTLSNEEVAAASNILFIAIKPYQFASALPAIAASLKKDCIIVSVAAGQSIAAIEALLGPDIKLIRAMPNTPALVGESMSALCRNNNVTDDELALIKQLFECFGKAEVVTESMMDAVIGVAGSSPAYVYMFIEAMADAAVLAGILSLF